MQRNYSIIVGVLLMGAIIAVLTAQPPLQANVDQRSTEVHSDIFFTYTTIRYPSRVEILEVNPNANLSIGVNTDTQKLDFGNIIGMGGTVKRQINLTTTDGKNSRIRATAHGDIAPLLRFDRTDFLFNGRAVISVTLDTMQYPAGNYTGEIDVIIQRSNNDLIRILTGY